MSNVEELIQTYFSSIPPESITITPLAGGLTAATNFRVEAAGKRYVCRLLDPTVPKNIRQRECYALQAAAIAGISPFVYRIFADEQAVLMELVDGKTVTIDEAKKPDNCIKIAKTLRIAHHIKKNPIPRENLREEKEVLFSDLSSRLNDDRGITIVMELFRRGSDALEKINASKVNIHGDLNPRNIFIKTDSALLIDWTDTNWEDPYYDLSLLSLFHAYSEVEEMLLLESYSQRPLTPVEDMRYRLAKMTNLAGLSFNCHFFVEEMLAKGRDRIDPTVSLKNWNTYMHRFAANEPLTAQFMYELAQVAYAQAQEIYKEING